MTTTRRLQPTKYEWPYFSGRIYVIIVNMNLFYHHYHGLSFTLTNSCQHLNQFKVAESNRKLRKVATDNLTTPASTLIDCLSYSFDRALKKYFDQELPQMHQQNYHHISTAYSSCSFTRNNIHLYLT